MFSPMTRAFIREKKIKCISSMKFKKKNIWLFSCNHIPKIWQSYLKHSGEWKQFTTYTILNFPPIFNIWKKKKDSYTFFSCFRSICGVIAERWWFSKKKKVFVDKSAYLTTLIFSKLLFPLLCIYLPPPLCLVVFLFCFF